MSSRTDIVATFLLSIPREFRVSEYRTIAQVRSELGAYATTMITTLDAFRECVATGLLTFADEAQAAWDAGNNVRTGGSVEFSELPASDGVYPPACPSCGWTIDGACTCEIDPETGEDLGPCESCDPSDGDSSGQYGDLR